MIISPHAKGYSKVEKGSVACTDSKLQFEYEYGQYTKIKETLYYDGITQIVALLALDQPKS